MNKIVIVDSDTLLYSAAAVSEARTIEVLHEPTGLTKEFKTRTEFKDLMKSKDKEITPDYKITDRQTPEPVEHCLHLVKSSAEQILSKYDFCDVAFVAGDVDNFRLDLPLPTRYKSNRVSMIRPIWLKEAHEYFRNKYGAKKAKGYEADDLVSILANDAIKNGDQAILLSKDKDSRQTIGAYLGDYSTPEEEMVYIRDFHPVTSEENGTKSYGVPWICIQLLVGDSTDCYKPTELTVFKYGEVSAYKDLKDCTTPQECLLKVVDKYKLWYPEPFEYTAWDGKVHEADWKKMLQLYFSCVKMKTSEDDDLNAEAFFSKYGVDL